MTCEVLMGRWLRRCGDSARLYRIMWRDFHLGTYRLCPDHCSLIINAHPDVAVDRVNARYSDTVRPSKARTT